jgi:hypothetical protein
VVIELKKCISCDEIIEPQERWTEAGLDYCKEYECLKKCGQRISGVAVVMVHKQGFNVISTESAVGQNFMDASGHM